MEILKDLELVEVAYENDNKKAVLTFLVEDRGEVREVSFNKQDYVDGQFVNSEEKAKKVDEWCEKYFNTTFDKLTDCLGVRMDIYDYVKFCSLWESEMANKFQEDMVGEIGQALIKDIKMDNVGIRIIFTYDNLDYESKMTYSKYLENQKKFLVDPQKKAKQLQKFEEKFHVNIDDKEKLLGKSVTFEVKKAMGKYIYAEIKPFSKKTKK